MKIKGAELIKFLDEETGGWPQIPASTCWYWDHDEFDEMPDPEVTYDTYALGDVFFQNGEGFNEDPTDGEGYSLAMLIRRWRKEQKVVTLVVDVPKEIVNNKKDFDSFKGALKSFGAKLIK